MKVESGSVTIVRISDIISSHRLDPIRVTLDDIEHGRGRVNIECFGKAWASYWDAMGDTSVAKFFASCDTSYLIGCLSPGLYDKHFTSSALKSLCRATIRGRRKGTRKAMREYDRITRAEASALMAEVDAMDVETEAACYSERETLERVFGTDGVMNAVQASEPNPEYLYFARICNAVREALIELATRKENKKETADD